jgi:RNA polymerase sigma-70 factor (ECF subfamily)
MNDGDPRTDAELLGATPKEIEAFGVFYRRHVEWVLGFLGRQLRDPERAADLTAEVFAAALLSAQRYQPARGEPQSWLYGIVQNKLASAGRRGAVERRARRRLGMGAVEVTAEDAQLIEALADRVDGRAAMDMLADLPEDQREAVKARVLEDRDYPEIATALAISPVTARKRVSRGLATLRARMQETEEEQP